MNNCKRYRDVLGQVMLVIVSLMLANAPVSAQNSSLAWQYQHCNRIIEQSNVAAETNSWQTGITLNQQLMSECSEIMDPARKAGALFSIGVGFHNLGRNEEAIPVLQRCASLFPEFAGCWVELADASYELRRISDARAYYRKCIGTGATDQINADFIQSAREQLAKLDRYYPEENIHNQPKETKQPQHRFGTGFFVSNAGHIVTNNHVVAGCRTLAARDGKKLQVVAKDPNVDLALLKADVSPSNVAVFRGGAPPRLGEGVVVFGFPLPGILSSGGNLTTGVLSATSGLADDVRLIQITAPVQPGNSGGPVFDTSGHVIGVVVSKLDVIQVAEATGDLAQNVNFAVHWAAVRSFLDEQGVRFRHELSQRRVSTSDVAELASKTSVALECTE
jgi:S1-C subfamily serine protease